MDDHRTMSSKSGPIRILLADSDELRCQMLTSALRRRSEFVVHPCAMDADMIRRALLQSDEDVAVICSDSRGPEVCLPILRSIHLAHPRVGTVLLSETLNSELVVGAFRSGAHGVFCHGDAHLRDLCKCIHCVQEGQVWANSQQLCCLLDVLARVPALRILDSHGDHLLTAREEQVVALVSDGLSNREVARELNLSEHTIKKYLFRIFDKLGISTRVELVLYAMSHGNSREAEWIPGN
jgi:DNA-binding NarL/FixJ family response regulator